MIHKVKLKVRDEERWLTSVSYGYHIKFSDAPDIDKIIQLHQEVTLQLGSEQVLPIEGGFLRLRFSSTDHDQFFYDWLFTSMMEEGGIEFLQNEVEAVSRISFWDCYCVGVEEWMSTDGAPMGIELLLSPAILKKDALVHEKAWKITDIHGNTEEVKVIEEEAPKSPPPPTPLITAVTGKTSALPNAVVEYKVADYNLPNISSSDKARIKWMVKVEDKEFSQKTQGEILKLTIDEAWAGKDIVVMPYLKKYTPKVSVKTKVEIAAVIIYVNGYWNSGKSDISVLNPMSPGYKFLKKLIAENVIGTKNKMDYWDPKFLVNANTFFIRKLNEWTSQDISRTNIISLYIDGSNVFTSLGQTRFNAGWDEAEILLEKVLKNHKVINADGKQMKKIFVISHSMGAAHAEGMISSWVHHGLIIEYVMHFSAADNRDFQVKLPHCTYQINIVPDPVLIYKNFDDITKTKWENFWNMMKRPYLDRPSAYMIERMKPAHYIEIRNDWTFLNHAYTKWKQVWNMVQFLK